MNNLEQKIIVRCKHCGWRIFDKVTMTTGVIELKCPNCHRVVEVDLSLRRGNVKYRSTCRFFRLFQKSIGNQNETTWIAQKGIPR